jgi:MFS superfamily sulfate permease-like transporter
LPIGASLSNSAASDAAGGKTQGAGIVAALATILVALFLTPLFFNLPEAALAAIVIVAVSGMVKIGQFRRLYRLRKGDFWLAAITFLCVLTFEEVLAGLLIGVLLSLLALIWRTSSARLSVLGRVPGSVTYRSTAYHPEVIRDPGLLITRPDEEVFFANAAPLRSKIRKRIASSETPIRTTILDLEMTNELDVPSTEMLAKLHEEHEAVKIQFKLVGIHAPVREILEASGVTERIGEENIYPTVLEAVLAYASEHLEEISADDIETFIDRIDALTEFFTSASEHVSEEHRTKLSAAIDRLEEARSRLESDTN